MSLSSAPLSTLPVSTTSSTWAAALGDDVASSQDGVSVASLVLGGAAEDAGVADDAAAAAQVYTSVAADSVVAADGVVGNRVYSRTISDSRPARDDLPRPTGVRVRQGSTSDTVNPDIGINVLVQLAAVAPVVEAVAAADVVSAGEQTFNEVVQDSATPADITDQSLTFTLISTDSAVSLGAWDAIATFVVDAGNGGATSDDLELDGSSIYRTLVSDTSVSSDDIAVDAAATADVLDTAAGDDTADASGMGTSQVSDQVASGDTVGGDYAAPTVIADASTHVDVITAELVSEANLADIALAKGYANDYARFRRRVMWVS